MTITMVCVQRNRRPEKIVAYITLTFIINIIIILIKALGCCVFRLGVTDRVYKHLGSF